MCGIFGGIWKRSEEGLAQRLSRALASLRHRGPNDHGLDLIEVGDNVVAFGHTRLSIIDLSAGGHQPMFSPDGRYAMVFNGEIYNYRELRSELKLLGIHFVTDSDSEVLLHAWRVWNVESLDRLDGMFAFVVHDREKRTLTSVRDPFGIKPFYYSTDDSEFAFASEQPALVALRRGKPTLDWQRSYDYLVHGDYDSQERTFVEGNKQLMPGHLLRLDLTGRDEPILHRWWSPSSKEHSDLTFESAAEAVREQFLKNVRLQLRSDVPVGAALSGGIDSSAIVCAMRHVEPDVPINTFSFVAKGSPVSEENWIDIANEHSGAIAHKVLVSPQDLFDDIDDLIRVQGEPFGSTSIYAQYRVFKLAREHGIVVTLDGQGADELLAGYSGYPGYRILSLLEERNYSGAFNFYRAWSKWPGRSYKMAALDLGRSLLSDGTYATGRRLAGRAFSPNWLDVGALRENGVFLHERRVRRSCEARGRRVIERLGNSLGGRGLPQLLRHGDRNSMRFSIESRVPFLSIDLANLLYSLPERYLISEGGETKSVFRRAMRGIVPDAILDRRDKIGFATPEREWLRPYLAKIRTAILESEGIPFLRKELLRKRLDQVIRKDSTFDWQVWRWANFMRWHQIFMVT